MGKGQCPWTPASPIVGHRTHCLQALYTIVKGPLMPVSASTMHWSVLVPLDPHLLFSDFFGTPGPSSLV